MSDPPLRSGSGSHRTKSPNLTPNGRLAFRESAVQRYDLALVVLLPASSARNGDGFFLRLLEYRTDKPAEEMTVWISYRAYVRFVITTRHNQRHQGKHRRPALPSRPVAGLRSYKELR
jgi:hypothetical protein